MPELELRHCHADRPVYSTGGKHPRLLQWRSFACAQDGSHADLRNLVREPRELTWFHLVLVTFGRPEGHCDMVDQPWCLEPFSTS